MLVSSGKLAIVSYVYLLRAKITLKQHIADTTNICSTATGSGYQSRVEAQERLAARTELDSPLCTRSAWIKSSVRFNVIGSFKCQISPHLRERQFPVRCSALFAFESLRCRRPRRYRKSQLQSPYFSLPVYFPG